MLLLYRVMNFEPACVKGYGVFGDGSNTSRWACSTSL